MIHKDFWPGFPDRCPTSAVDLVLYFSEEAEDQGRELLELLDNEVAAARIETFTDIEELITDIKRPEMEPAVLVLVIGSIDELEEFSQLLPVLEKAKIYVVLQTEATAETMALAERLHPEFISRPDEDLSEVATLIDMYLQEQRISPSAGILCRRSIICKICHSSRQSNKHHAAEKPIQRRL
jgi:hypothetical protein